MTGGFAPVREAIHHAIKRAGGRNIASSNVRAFVLTLFAEFKADDRTLKFFLDHKQAQEIHSMARGLEDRDLFRATRAAAFVQPMRVVNGVQYPGNSRLYSYPDPTVFNNAPVAPAVLPEHENLEMFFNAKMKYQSDESVRQEDFDMHIFRDVPETQASATTLPSMNESYFVDLGRDVNFVGGDKNFIEVTLPEGEYANIIGNADHKNYACIKLAGALTKNGAKKNI